MSKKQKHPIKHRMAQKRVVRLPNGCANAQLMRRLDYLHRMAVQFPEMSCHLNKELFGLASNMQQRLDPSVKHTFCRKCFKGFGSALYEIVEGKLSIVCRSCGNRKIIGQLRGKSAENE